jgi:hypothetical protein
MVRKQKTIWSYFYRFYFLPGKNVKYSIENFRVEAKKQIEKLVLK